MRIALLSRNVYLELQKQNFEWVLPLKNTFFDAKKSIKPE